MNFLKVAGKEIKNIFGNKFMRVALIPILGLPILYSLIYLSAFWDPYGKMEKFPVAVVNLDKGTTVDDEEKNFGEEMVKQFKDSKEMDWHFTDEKDADEGLEGKKYYVKLLIPEDFSKRLSSAQEGKPNIANLKVTTNPKKNYIGAQMGSSIEGKIKKEITAKITEGAVESSFNILFDVKDGLATAADASGKLSDGAGKLNEGIPLLAKGIDGIANGSKGLLEGQIKVNSGIVQVSSGLKEVNGKMPVLGEGASILQDGSTGLKDGIKAAENSSNKLSQGSDGLYNAFKESIYPSVNQLKIAANQLNKAFESSSQNTQRTQALPSELKNNGEKISNSSNNILSGYGEVKSSVDDLSASSASNKKVMDSAILDLQKALESGEKGDIESALKKMQALSADSKNNLEEINEIKKGAASFNSKLKEYSNGVDNFTNDITRYKTSSNQTQGNMEEIAKGINQMSNALNALEKGLNENNQGSFGSGLKTISQNMGALNNGLGKLESGAQKLNEGAVALNSNVPMLQQAIGGLSSGSSNLVEGSGAVLAGQEKIVSGSNSLNKMVPEIKGGVGKLSDGSTQLSEKLGESSTNMADGLKNPSEVMAEFVKEPIDVDSDPINPVDNYGTVFAPYIMPLSLWIGALLILMVMSSKDDKNIITSKFHGVFGKYLGLGLIAILQAVLTGACVMALGLEPTNVPLFFLLMMLFSLVFLAIIYCLMSLLGQAGNLLVMIFLIFQLVGSEGTFPLELQPAFINAINPFLPFTYVLEALREVISATTINYSVIGKDALVLSVMGLIFLTISIIFKRQGSNETNEIAQV